MRRGDRIDKNEGLLAHMRRGQAALLRSNEQAQRHDADLRVPPLAQHSRIATVH